MWVMWVRWNPFVHCSWECKGVISTNAVGKKGVALAQKVKVLPYVLQKFHS